MDWMKNFGRKQVGRILGARCLTRWVYMLKIIGRCGRALNDRTSRMYFSGNAECRNDVFHSLYWLLNAYNGTISRVYSAQNESSYVTFDRKWYDISVKMSISKFKSSKFIVTERKQHINYFKFDITNIQNTCCLHFCGTTQS